MSEPLPSEELTLNYTEVEWTYTRLPGFGTFELRKRPGRSK